MIICIIQLFRIRKTDKNRSVRILIKAIVVVCIIFIAGVSSIVIKNSNDGYGISAMLDSSRINYYIGTLTGDSDMFLKLNRLLSGRLEIWSEYIQLIDIRGHDSHVFCRNNTA